MPSPPSTVYSLGPVLFDGPGEDQIDWIDRLWLPVGQSVYYSLSADIHINENVRSGRPITLQAALPYCWLESATVTALETLAALAGQTHLLTLGSITKTVVFRRDLGSLDLTPVDPLRHYFTGKIYLLEV